MKIRTGFVSNSSSSSFCIYGIQCDNFLDEIKEYLKSKLSEKEFKELYYDEDGNEIPEEDFDEYEVLEKFCELTNLEYYIPEGSYYIGRSYSTIGDNETGKQFKESVNKNLSDVFGKKIKCEHQEMAYWN